MTIAPADVVSAINTHEAEADPHVQYQRESEKAQASGYCPLDSGSQVPVEHLAALTSGIDWQDSVISDTVATPPGSPTTGDRYLLPAGSLGAWATHDEKIAEWDGSAWDFTAPNKGFAVHVEDTGLTVIYNGAHPAGSWVSLGTTIAHNSLVGLTLGDPHTQYQKESEKDAANGYPSLDSTTKVPAAEIPDRVADSVFGDASDGDADFDGTNTFGFASTTGAAPNLIYTLTRDVFLDDCTIRASKRLNGGNFKPHVAGVCTIEALGLYAQDGNDAVGLVAGAAIAASGTLNASAAAGGAGKTIIGAGNPGGGLTNSFAGDGGAGGTASGGNTGGAGGSAADPIAAAGRGNAFPYALLSRLISGITLVSPNSGAGGGGGGANFAVGTASSGAGGGGAGKLFLAARTLNNLGTIRARGGAGSNGSVTGDGSAGGGGGGGGGEIQILVNTLTAIGTINVDGGTFGTGAGAGSASGVAGAVGKLFIYP